MERSTPPSYRTALVTGASSGIGRAVALALRDEGLEVIAVARNAAALAQLRDESGVEPIQVDVRDTDAMRAVLDGRAIDVLVNNAGVLASRAEFTAIEETAIDEMIDVNIRATMHLTRMIASGMAARHHGHVVFIGSSAGLAPHPRAAVYGASKAAISLFSDALRCDLLGAGVRVTDIDPGRVDTPLLRAGLAAGADTTPLAQYLQPEDIAALVMTALRMPAHVNVSRIEVFPTIQAVGGSLVAPDNDDS